MFALTVVTLAPSMLSDRSYIKDGYGGRATSVLVWLLSAIAAGFVIQLVVHRWFGEAAGRSFDFLLGLSVDGIKAGQFWTLFTYGFLHDTGPLVLLHVLLNCLALWFLGKELLPLLGSRRFLILWFFGLLCGGLLWMATNWRFTGSVIGASPAIASMLVLYGCLSPNHRITVLFFFIPVTVVVKYVVFAALALEMIGWLLFDAVGKASPLGWEHSAHLGGMAAGWMYYRWVHLREWQNPDARPEMELPRWFKKSKAAPTPPPAFKVNLTTREDMKAEVDRILDKINSEGFNALTAEERRILDDARNVMSKP